MIRTYFICIVFIIAVLFRVSPVFALDINTMKQELNTIVSTIDIDLPETLTDEQKQEVQQDLPYLREYSSSFLSWAREIQDGTGNNDGYGAWGLVIDDDFVKQIELAENEAEAAGKTLDYRGAQIGLRKWLIYYLALSAHVDFQIKDIDYNSINTTIVELFTQVDAWLDENEALGYTVSDERIRFDALKNTLTDVKSSWGSEFADYNSLQSAYYVWGTEYDEWAKRAEAEFDRQYKAMQEDVGESEAPGDASSSGEFMSPNEDKAF
ncbi:MAG: hypothetical protein AAB508_06060 [Patescibacteria group bacterium]